MDCIAAGNPTPTLFWMKEGETNILLPGTHIKQLTVTPEGSLRIGKYLIFVANVQVLNTKISKLLYKYRSHSFLYFFPKPLLVQIAILDGIAALR